MFLTLRCQVQEPRLLRIDEMRGASEKRMSRTGSTVSEFRSEATKQIAILKSLASARGYGRQWCGTATSIGQWLRVCVVADFALTHTAFP